MYCQWFCRSVVSTTSIRPLISPANTVNIIIIRPSITITIFSTVLRPFSVDKVSTTIIIIFGFTAIITSVLVANIKSLAEYAHIPTGGEACRYY